VADGVLVARELGEGLAAAVLAEGESEQACVLVVALLLGGAGVGGDFGFALGGFGAGGELGVTTIGFDFELG
jgi:hypothetical protein